MSPLGRGLHERCLANAIPIDSERGMQINDSGKHHALTEFYLDKSVDTDGRSYAYRQSDQNTATN